MLCGLKSSVGRGGLLILLLGPICSPWAGAQNPAVPPAPPVQPPSSPVPTFRLPDDRLGLRVAPILLLSREDVIADLKLDRYQAAQAQQAIGELYEQAAALKGRREAEVVEARRRIDQACAGWIQQWLSSEQQTRLLQIDLQWEGPSALINRPTVAAAIELSETQRDQLRRAVLLRDQMRAQGKPIAEAERLLAEQALSLLEPAQRDRWKAMLGEVFQPNLGGLQDPGLKAASASQAAPPSQP